MPPDELGRELRAIAAHVNAKAMRKHPRGPKPKAPKGYAPRAAVDRHVATARVLADGGVRE
jgi:hypothetical protein